MRLLILPLIHSNKYQPRLLNPRVIMGTAEPYSMRIFSLQLTQGNILQREFKTRNKLYTNPFGHLGMKVKASF